jgi:hypothetical protein
MTKKVAILQSNYIPWKGYFDLIASVDEFILYDDVQYTRRDWRNRNIIKTPQGLLWLSVPVEVKGKYTQKIKDTKISDSKWTSKHWKTLVLNYRRASCFGEISEYFYPYYNNKSYIYLSNLNRDLIEAVCKYLNIDTKISTSTDYGLSEGDKTERLVDLCLKTGATEYVSGPAAKSYMDKSLFSRHNIKVSWADYSDYAEYPQLWGEFEHKVSIVDLLFNCGKNSKLYMKYI